MFYQWTHAAGLKLVLIPWKGKPLRPSHLLTKIFGIPCAAGSCQRKTNHHFRFSVDLFVLKGTNFEWDGTGDTDPGTACRLMHPCVWDRAYTRKHLWTVRYMWDLFCSALCDEEQLWSIIQDAHTPQHPCPQTSPTGEVPCVYCTCLLKLS